MFRAAQATHASLAAENRLRLRTHLVLPMWRPRYCQAGPAGARFHREALKEADMVDMHLEVDIIPVSDVDRAKQFYQRLGWRLDADDSPLPGLRIVQFTPPGSAASVTFGLGLTAAAPGSAEGGLVVSDIVAAHNELTGRGIDASDMWHGPPFPVEARQPGPDPEHTSYGSFCSFTDPDGNTWLVQEVTTRLPGRVGLAIARAPHRQNQVRT